MPFEQALLTWIHLVSASIWVGGSIFLGIVLSPLLRTMYESVEKRLQIMIKVGRRFNKIAVPSLIILIVTGMYNSQFFFSDPQTLTTTSYGNFLLIKIILVIALVITYAIHVRLISKDIEEKIMASKISQKQLQSVRTKIIILGEITVALSVAILFFAAMLDAGV